MAASARRDAFAAIADPTRRSILELLRDRGTMKAGDIAARFPAKSRPGISRHLRVLRECGVVRSVRAGKAREYELDARPLAALRNGWLASFGEMQAASLRRLRDQIEGPSR